jgi:repressor LexA
MIPLYESVSAGFGAVAIDEVIDYVPLFIPNPIEARETLCIRVTGDSMYPKIENGDIIQVHKQDSVDSGSIAVVLLDNEDGLVKKVVYSDTWIELHSINPMYKTMRFNGPDVMRVRVLGKVNKVIKSL